MYGKFPSLVLNTLKLSIKINVHTFWAQIVSSFDGFVACGFNSVVQFVVVVVVVVAVVVVVVVSNSLVSVPL